MRILVIGLALLCLATPASAQVSALELDNLRAQQDAAQRRAVDLENQLMAAEARSRAEQASRDLDLSRRFPRSVPQPPYPYAPRALSAHAAARGAPSIPDDMLADSNRRVQAAAGARR